MGLTTATLARTLLGLTLCGPVIARAIAPELPLRALSLQTWGQEAGLPQISVRDLAQDRDGQLWVATENGLARFDGSRFEIFRQADTPALKASWISQVELDQAGRLWVGTVKNLAVYENGRFTPVTAEGRETGKVNGLVEAPATRELYVAADTLFRLREGRLEAVPGWSGTATAIHATADALWVARQGRVTRLDAAGPVDFALPTAWADAVISQMAWSAGTLWLATTRGLLHLEGQRFVPLRLEATDLQPDLQSIAADGEAGLWVASAKVLYRLQNGRVIERLDLPAAGVPQWPLTIQPGPGSVWIGSQTEGLQHSWISPARRFSVEDGLPEPMVWSFWNDGSRLLIGTNAGVASWADGRITPLIAASALPNPVAYTLLRDTRGVLWVGTRAGLARFARDGAPLEAQPALAGLQVNGLTQTRDGAVWAASTGGLFRIDGETVRHFGEADGLRGQRVRFLLEARDGVLWVGSENGLLRQRGERFEPVPLAGKTDLLITSLLELPDGRLVVGTYDNGIYLRGGDSWQHWGAAQGLPSQTVFFLGLVDGWLVGAGGDGVYRLPLVALDSSLQATLPAEVLVGNPGERQGRARIRCCNGAGNGKGLIRDGQAWLPTLDGALRVQVDGPATLPPMARIDQFEQALKPLPLAPQMRLEGLPRDAVIRYGAIDYRDPARLQFRYRLNGFEQDWIQAGERRTAIYTNLPPGRFNLEVQARHPFGPWGPSAMLALEVPKRFFETWLFRALCLLLLALLVFALVRWRLRRLEAQKLELERMVEERTRALADTNAQLAAVNEELQVASYTDALTGLRNRRFLQQAIPQMRTQLARRRADSGRDLVIGVVLIDIDHFKRINDRFGHAVGDEVLQRIAIALSAAVREGEFVLRWGGEEFLAILDGADRAHLDAVVLRLHRAIASSCVDFEVAPGQLLGQVTASAGFAAYPVASIPGEYRWQNAVEAADHALYAAKTAGRNRCVTFDFSRVPASEWPPQITAHDIVRWTAAGYVSPRIVDDEATPASGTS